MLDVSIIIVNYNTLKMTDECICSVIEKTSGVSYEIILVDNASTDGSREFFSADSRVRYIYNEENLGFGKANNKGIEIAQGRNILFLNSDTLLVDNAVKILSGYLDSHMSVGACGGNLLNPDMTPSASFRMYAPSIFAEISRFFKFLPDKFLWGRNTEFNHTGRPLKVFFIWGADLMVRKSVLDEVGGFDPSFFMYYEDTELCWRIRKKYDIMSVPNARIIHIFGASSEQDKSKNHLFRKTENEKSKQIYLSLTHSAVYVKVTNLFNRLTLMTRIHR